LRVAGPDDLSALYRFEVLCFREHRFRRDHIDWILRHERALTLVEDGPEGVTAAMMLLFEGSVCRVLSVAVAPEHRRRGIGTRMMRAAETTCQERGLSAIRLEVSTSNLAAIGMKVRTISVTHSTMFTRFCNVPRQEPNICPNVGWIADFHEPQAMLDATFNGKNIVPVNNSNWPQLNDPRINALMARAETIVDPQQRFAAWARIDQLVTKTAVAIPWLWETNPVLFSDHATKAPELWNQGEPDVSSMQVVQ